MRYSSILSVVDIPRSQPGAIRHGVNSGGGDSFLSDRLWPTATTHGGIHHLSNDVDGKFRLG
jgi:hypothetical protein